MTYSNDWGKQLESLYAQELADGVEDELWLNQKPTGRKDPTDEELESVEESKWGAELARVYSEELSNTTKR